MISLLSTLLVCRTQSTCVLDRSSLPCLNLTKFVCLCISLSWLLDPKRGTTSGHTTLHFIQHVCHKEAKKDWDDNKLAQNFADT